MKLNKFFCAYISFFEWCFFGMLLCNHQVIANQKDDIKVRVFPTFNKVERY